MKTGKMILENLIKKTLAENGDPEHSIQCRKYFKRVLKFHGIKSPQFKIIFRELYRKHIKSLDLKGQLKLAYNMIASEYGDEKRFGIEILLKNVKSLDKRHIKEIGKLFKKNVYDWATCDGLSGMLIGRMIKINASIADEIYPWKDSDNLWMQRASCVAFVPVARFGDFNKLIINIVTVCVKNSERFVQLGVGWVLRELSLADLDMTVHFIKRNYRYFSREGLRYAIEKMQPALRKELLEFRI